MNPTHTNKNQCKKTYEIFGDQWNLQIAEALGEDECRFNDIQRQLGINSATLTTKLKRLEELKLIDRLEKTRDKQSVTYKLTPYGTKLLPIIQSMLEFTQNLE